jgi:ATP-dependent Clp protease ATP-binding subunit ClpA
LHGQEGVGQGAVVSALSRFLQSDDAPKRLKGATIHRFSLANLMFAPTDNPKEHSVDVLSKLIRETADHNKSGKPPVILCLDDVGLHAGEKYGYGNDFLVLRSVLAEQLRAHSVPLICSVSNKDLFTLRSTDKELMKHFQSVDVPPLSMENTLKEIRHIADELESIHGIKISNEALEHLTKKVDINLPLEAQSGKSVRILGKAAASVEASGTTEMTDLHIDQTIAYDTNRPLSIVRSELADNIRDLEKNMKGDVFGQDEAIEAVCKKLRLVSSDLKNPNKPLATFNFNGGTGIGKSFIPKRLAFHLFGSEENLIRLDLTGFGDKHTVSRIVGAPPGYVGYEDKGVLDDVIDKPFSVILVDEEDKADSNVRNALLPVLDEARLDKLDGKRLDFRNTIIIMTGNRGATEAQDAYSKPAIGFSEATPEQRRADAQKARTTEMKQGLSPEFRNRVTEVHLNMLERPHIEKIALREIESVSQILRDNKKFKDITITVVPSVVQELADIGFDPLMGARPMERAVEQSFTIPLNDWLNEDANKGLLGQSFELVVKGIKNGFEWEVKKPAPLLSLPAPVVP